jgi:hypothetical protein
MRIMNVKVIVHKTEEGGYWAEVPALPGCVSQGETTEEIFPPPNESVRGTDPDTDFDFNKNIEEPPTTKTTFREQRPPAPSLT